MWDLIVSVPDHYLSFYFKSMFKALSPIAFEIFLSVICLDLYREESV